jgi:hypothetical protein
LSYGFSCRRVINFRRWLCSGIFDAGLYFRDENALQFDASVVILRVSRGSLAGLFHAGF